MRAVTHVAPFILPLALLSLGARQTGTGSISGRATHDGQPLPGVRVVASSGNAARTAVTDAEGRYRLGDLPSGVYRIEATLAGFRREVLESIEVAAGRNTERSFSMRLRILAIVDYVLPVDGLIGAVRAADVIVHLRVLEAVDVRPLGSGGRILATEHRARVLEVVKGQERAVVGGTLTFWQDMAGEWVEDGVRIAGSRRPYGPGEEYVAFLRSDPEAGLREYLGFHLMLRIVDGRVPGGRNDLGISEAVTAAKFLALLRELLNRDG